MTHSTAIATEPCAWMLCSNPGSRQVYATRLCVDHENAHFAHARQAGMGSAISAIELLAKWVNPKTEARLLATARDMRDRADAAAAGTTIVALD